MKIEPLITLKYLFTTKDTPAQSVCVKYHTCTQEEHDAFQKQIFESDDVVSCCFEYICEIAPEKTSILTTIKRKEQNNEETPSKPQ